jgi:hypothetical protein
MRLPGRPCPWWEDNNKTNLKEFENKGMNCIQFAYEMAERRVLVDSVMNF